MSESISNLGWVILAVFAWWIFFIEQQAYWLDLTRQKLFAIRNNIFDTATSGRMSFNDPAYIITRNTLNGMISFAHEVNLVQLVAIYLTHKHIFKGRRATDYEKRLSKAMSELSEENRTFIIASMREAHHVMLKHVMSTSFIIWIWAKPLSVVLALLRTHFNEAARESILDKKEEWQVIDAEALHIDEYAAGDDSLLRAA